MKRSICRVVLGAVLSVFLSLHVSAARMLVPMGTVIGIELSDGSVSVAAIDDAMGANARAAGLQVGDRIVAVDDKAVDSAQEIRYALERADGTVELEIQRSGQRMLLTVTPQVTTQGPRLGVFLRQGINGIGTVTWYDADSGAFGALGHGVNTPSGELLAMQWGKVYPAEVTGVQKGKAGQPGQLLGTVKSSDPMGTLEKNTPQGIFGILQPNGETDAIPTAEPEQIRQGPATIRSTVSDGAVQEYSVEILKIYPNEDGAERNMLLRVTDPRLLEATGGIVQGMSGSPIIQNGKLVGAVTHVLVNDPTRGYGIFIENMLEAAG